MEDGSAYPVESILAQSGGLGFYQKRLFFCSCFLQALTVSALIYASHCRPDLVPPQPIAATNGARAHPSKCHRSRLDNPPEDQLARNASGSSSTNASLSSSSTSSSTNFTFLAMYSNNESRIVNVSDGSSGTVVAVGGGGGGTLKTTTASSLVKRDVSRHHDKTTDVWVDVSTGDSGLATSETSAQRKHRKSPKEENRGGLNKGQTTAKTKFASTEVSSIPVFGEEDVTEQFGETEESFSDADVTVTAHSVSEATVIRDKRNVSVGGYEDHTTHASSPTPDKQAVDYVGAEKEYEFLKDEDSNVNSDVVSATPNAFTGEGSPERQKQDLSHPKQRASRAESTNGGTSTEFVINVSTDNADVTTSNDDDDDECHEKHDTEKEDPFYLTLTYLPAPEWLGDDVDKERLAHYNHYCQTVGAMVGAALGAMGADQAGRRKPLYVYLPLMLIAHCMSGFAVSWTMLAVFRFLVGVFAGACAVVSLVFPLEFIGSEWRDACVCCGIWVVGVVLISLELLITRHWRYLAFISGGIGLPLVGTYFIASESARWLLCHQKFPDAESTLKEIVSCNSTSVPDFLSLFDKSRACVVTNMHNKRYTFLDLFHSVEMTKWTFALVYTCLVGSSVYFCLLAKVKIMTGNVYLDTSLPFVIDLPLSWSAIVVNRCLGRRWCLFLYAVASGLALLSVLILHMTSSLSHMPSMIIGMAVFGKIGVTASLGLVFVIAVEMYPTVVRCMGVAIAVIAVSGGSLLAEAFVFLEAYHYTVPFVVFGAMMASVGFAGLLFPETLHRPLPNILPCRHRTIPLHEGVRLVTNPWDVL